MYNGIGLQTPRGSGTNGYVQRNMSFVPKSREKVNYRTEEDIKKLDALANKKPNEAILAHERKRLVELKCFEMQELMEDQGYPEDEIESKVSLFRQMLLEKEDCPDIPKDALGRPSVKESHQMAEANQEKNLKMREALGISQYFVEGSSLDPARKAKEAAAAEEAKKKYALIPDSSSSSPERTQEKEKVKKRKKKKSGNNDEKLDSAKKKKSSKKHKKDRSVSPEHQKKKKSKKSTKDKLKHKSKKSRTRSSSSSSVVSSSSSADDESSSRSSSVSSITQSDGSSYERHKHSSKADRNPKSHKKHSLSPESALYTKDSRSRKDLYEAKKGKHKRKSGRSPTTSTSEDDSSPKQYYRLEPVLLKSKTKHKKTRQFIELPKKSTYELKKKKRVYDSSTSSSSSSPTKSKSRSKYRKRSSSPENSKASKYHSSRNEDSCKSSKRHPKTSCSPEEKMHKSKHKKSISEDRGRISRRSKNKAYDDKNSRKYHKSSDKLLYKRTSSTSPEKFSTKKKQESPKKRKDGKKSPKHRKDKNCSESPKVHRSHKTSSESLFRCQEQNSKSPNCHNGQSRSPSVVSGYSPGGPSSFSPFNEERFFTRSPSFPPKYKHKKHILNESPPYSSQTVSKNKISPKSSQKCSTRAVISGRSTSRSVSPDEFYLRKSKQRHSTSPQVTNTKRASQKKKSPDTRKRSKSKTSSPEVDAKQRKVYGDKSRSSSASNGTPDETPWKSKGEMKDVTLHSKNLSIVSKESSRNSPLKVNMSPDRKSPTTNSSSNVEVFQAVPNSVKRKLDDQQGITEDMPNKMMKLSPVRNRNSNSDNEKIVFNMKSISIPHSPLEDATAVEASEARENVNSSEKKGLSRKRSKTPESRATKKGSHSRSRSTSAAHSCSASDRSSSYSKSRSYSRSKSKSFSRSRSKSYSRSRSRSASLSSRSRSRSYSSRSRSRSIARSPSIPRRRGSPSFLDKRRITSARKRPVPYRRPSPPTPSSSEEGSSWSYRSVTPSSASSPRSYNSPIQATPFIHSFDSRV